ncbi:hypothetical protein [Paraburkholderia ferrariae]|uniref:hypothetical protein n=1 Tax=Paraburkholderia ferrariae TaxID=386056 RepID=UPI0012EB8B26|nr:hypothetical protein [Paraburkholderia ferrariae]
MKYIAMSAMVLLFAVSSAYGDGVSPGGAQDNPCLSCNVLRRPAASVSSAANPLPVSLNAARGSTADSAGKFFPVLPLGQRQFDTRSSKLHGERFRWSTP